MITKQKISKVLNVIALALVAFLTHQTILVCYMEGISPPRSCTYGSVQSQLGTLMIIALSTFLLIRIRQEGKLYRMVWQQNWLIGLFVLLALLSSLWTVFLPASIYRTMILLFVTVIAAYVGFRMSSRDLVIYVAVVVGVAALLSLLLVALLPNVGIMPNHPYTGLWRGIFWHKIYLGATMALGCLAYLVILFSPLSQYTRLQKILAAIMLVIALVLATLSDSATGLITLTVTTGIFVLILLLLKWGHLVPRWAYWVLLGALVLSAFLVIANLKFVFGLYNRSITLTGRTPLWDYLLKSYVAQRPFFGHGFGAFWLQPGINDTVAAVVGWKYAVKVSDNGYMDILLELGIIGLALLILILITGFKRVIPRALAIKDLTAFYPFLLLIHIVLVNISLSYFLQMESFIWFLLVTILFMHTKYSKNLSYTAE